MAKKPVTETTYQHNGNTYLTAEFFRFLEDNDLIIDCSAGGLVQGPSMAEGGIQMISPTREARIFVGAKVEGWHFLINDFAESDYRDELNALPRPSAFGDSFFEPYPIPDGIDIIRVIPKEVNGQIITPYLMHGTAHMAIVTKMSTMANLRRFNSMNRAAWQTHMIEANPEPTQRLSATLARLIPTSNN
jgi:hypothetical protein